MPALWIGHVTVTDEESYAKYAKLAGPAIAAHGGHFIARGGRYVQLEGTCDLKHRYACLERPQESPGAL